MTRMGVACGSPSEEGKQKSHPEGQIGDPGTKRLAGSQD